MDLVTGTRERAKDFGFNSLLLGYDTKNRLPYPLLFEMLDEHLSAAGANEQKKMDEMPYERFSDYATIFERLGEPAPTTTSMERLASGSASWSSLTMSIISGSLLTTTGIALDPVLGVLL